MIGGERNMKQRIPINSITSKLVLKSMYASCSTGPFFADHYSHRFEKTQLKFRQEKWLPVKISCIIWNEICKKNKLIKNRNGIFCQKFLIFLKSLKSLNKKFYYSLFSLQELPFIEIWTQEESTSWILDHRNNILSVKMMQTKRCCYGQGGSGAIDLTAFEKIKS